MAESLDLDELLARLRTAGIEVGVPETLRAVAVLSAAGGTRHLIMNDGLERIGALLRPVLVKRREDVEIFDRTFALWSGQLAELVEVPDRSAPERVPLSPPGQPGRSWWRRRRTRRIVSIALAALSVVLTAVTLVGRQRGWFGAAPPAAVQPVRETPAEQGPPSLPAGQDWFEALANVKHTAYVPAIGEPIPVPGPWQGWLPLTLGTVAAASLGLVLRAAGRRTLVEEPGPANPREGAPRVALTPAALAEPALIDRRDEEALAWGVGRYVTEVPTRRRMSESAVVMRLARSRSVMPRMSSDIASPTCRKRSGDASMLKRTTCSSSSALHSPCARSR